MTGDYGDVWSEKVIQLSQVAPAGPAPKLIQFRLRAKTGLDYDSDISFDDFRVTGTIVNAGPVFVAGAMHPGIGRTGNCLVLHDAGGVLNIFTLSGARVMSAKTHGDDIVSIAALPRGVYIAKVNSCLLKFAK
jgi:hypothetical protein